MAWFFLNSKLSSKKFPHFNEEECKITEGKVGHKFGEFAFTRKHPTYTISQVVRLPF
uniref:Ribosomal protein S19 n=1 Tax=Diplostephium hartwegii TaxID=1716017 RepID=A0A1U9GQ14_9ASTR|nr:ribosomal protein S19 [Diplostephium hartwegii]AOW70649.1 ribosomal protein S19 [Diplostephium hartwegii]